MTAVALSWSDSPKLPRMAAWLVVLLVHGLMALWLLGSGRMTLRSDEGARMTLYWLPPKQPVPAQPRPAQPTAEAARPAASTAPRPPPAAATASALRVSLRALLVAARYTRHSRRAAITSGSAGR